jgi:syndecan 1
MTADGSDRSFGAPRFDVVLRGYDRRQVDEHLARLQRLMGRMRSDLDAARGQPATPIGPPGGRPRPTPRPRPEAAPLTGATDVVGSFTDRMHAILQKAEEEAAEIRNKARAAAQADEERATALRASIRAEEETARKTLADLVRQRDAVLAELTRLRGQLEGLLSGPTTRITLPTQESGPERREAGAGQPLPGTPEAAEPPPEPVAVGVGSWFASALAHATAVRPAPVGVAEPADRPDPRGAAVPSAAETAIMEPLTGGPDGSEPETEAEQVEPVPAESAQAVKPPAFGSDDGRPADRDDSGEPVDEREPGAPTQVSSQAR